MIQNSISANTNISSSSCISSTMQSPGWGLKLLNTLRVLGRMVEGPKMDLSQARTPGGEEVKGAWVVTPSHWHRGLANLALTSNKDPQLFAVSRSF